MLSGQLTGKPAFGALLFAMGLLLLAGSGGSSAASFRMPLSADPGRQETPAQETVAWKDCLRQPPQWYASWDARRIAGNVLAWQRQVGGWPKNEEMSARLSQKQRDQLQRDRGRKDATIDNGATHTQLRFLALVYPSAPEGEREELKAAFLRGLDYLLEGQYPNGGWPQIFPEPTGYHRHITFNDDAMIGVLELLRDVGAGKELYRFVDRSRQERSRAAVEKGIDCLLRTQIVVDGKRTVWCAQHDSRTLAPASARIYEKASFSGSESVAIVRFLMSLENPSPMVIEAIEGAVAWFQATRQDGLKYRFIEAPSLPGGRDRVVEEAPGAPPIWARFYDLKTQKPIFCGRDGIVRSRMAEIDHERRTGYAWYTDRPRNLLAKDYPAWKQRIAPKPE